MTLRALLRLACLCCTIFMIHSEARGSDSFYSVPLKWINDLGDQVQLSDFKGKLVVLTLAYTRCKSACPLTMERLRKFKRTLEAQGKEAEFVIVSLDPEADSSSVLHQFRSAQKLDDPHWHLLSGSAGDLRKLSVLLGMSYQKDSKTDEIMHSNKLVVLDRAGAILDSLDGLNSDVTAFAQRIAAQ